MSADERPAEFGPGETRGASDIEGEHDSALVHELLGGRACEQIRVYQRVGADFHS